MEKRSPKDANDFIKIRWQVRGISDFYLVSFQYIHNSSQEDPWKGFWKAHVLVVVQSLSRVQLFVTQLFVNCSMPRFSVHQRNFSLSLFKLVSIKSVMPSNHLILCCPSSSVTPFSSCPQFFQHQGLFQWVSSSHQVAKVPELQLQHQSFQWIFKVDFL